MADAPAKTEGEGDFLPFAGHPVLRLLDRCTAALNALGTLLIVGIMLAINSPVGVVVSTLTSSATSAHPCACASAMSPAKSRTDRDSRSNFATTSVLARPTRTASRAAESSGLTLRRG